MKRLALILLMLGMIAGAAIPQMTPTFTGKLYNRAWYQSVPETWASYLMQLNVGGVTKIQFNADGSATFAGDITANGVVLGAGGGAVSLSSITDWPDEVSATEVGYLNGLTDTITNLLGGKADTSALAAYAPLDSPAFSGNLTLSTVGATVDGVDVGAIPTTYAPIDSPTFTTGITTPAIKVTGGTPGAGKVLTSDADGDGSWTTPSVTAPAGNDNQLQYNDNGSFGAANATWDAGRFEIGTTATGATLLVHSDRATPFTNYLISDVAAQIWPGLQFDLSAAAGVTPASGLGADMRMLMQTSTTASQPASRIETQWLDATHATRKAQLGLYVSEAHGEEVGLRVQATSGTPNIIGGYSGNAVGTGVIGSVIGGGGYASNVNTVHNNTSYSTLLGGVANTLGGAYNSILGGQSNSVHVTPRWCSIVGGRNNRIGLVNVDCSAILGGAYNELTTSDSDHSIIGGSRNKVGHTGVFGWSDSTDVDFSSAANNEVAIRASGGVRFVTNTAASTSAKTFAPANVNTSNEQITITSHGFASGQRVRFTSTATLPGGLAINTDYWITVVSPDVITVSNPGYNATPVNLTNSGTAGATHTATAYLTTETSIDTAGVLKPGGGYKSADGTAGMTDTRSWDDADGNTHAVTIKNGLITAWTVTPP